MSPLRWRNSFAFLLLLVLLVPILAACGGSGGAPAAAPTTGGAAVAPEATTAPTEATAATPAATEEPAEEATEAPAEEATEAPAEEATTEAAGGATGGTGATGGDKILRVHQPSYPDVVDPHKSSFSNEIAILHMAYEGLTKLDAELKPSPAAAERWEFNEAGDEITFHLREGLKFSDGSPLTSEHFAYAIQRTCDPNTAGEYQYILFEIEGCEAFATTPITDTAAYDAAKTGLGVETPDERTITLNLTVPAPYYPYLGGLWVMYPVKEEVIEQGGENWWEDPKNHIGNGPFRITDIQADQLISFEPNENYWGGRPKLDGVEYVYQTDLSIALEAYRAGQLDIAQIDPSDIPQIEGDPVLGAELQRFPGANTRNLQFNLTKPPFEDPMVRKAFSYAFDRQTYCEQIRSGDCIPTLTWIPEGVAGHTPTDKYGFDPEKAREALAQSTYGSADKLPEIRYTYSSGNPANQPRAEWIAGQYRDILGINIVLEPMENTALIEARKDVSTFPQITIAGWNQDYPDPQNWLSVYWKCGSFASRWGYCNEEFDTLVEQADQEQDPAQREQLYQQATEILIEDQPGPFLYHEALIYLVKPEVTGYDKTPIDSEWPGEWTSKLTYDINR